jgi:hypothetical protein
MQDIPATRWIIAPLGVIARLCAATTMGMGWVSYLDLH